MNLSKRATSVARMVQNHKHEQFLADTLFDRTEAALEYSEGFRGHPDLGVLFFVDLLSGLPEAAGGQQDEPPGELANHQFPPSVCAPALAAVSSATRNKSTPELPRSMDLKLRKAPQARQAQARQA